LEPGAVGEWGMLGVGSVILETPLVTPDGAALLGFHDRVIWLDPDGEVRWERILDANWSVEQPVMLCGAVLIGREDGVIQALDPAGGETLWTIRVTGHVRVLLPIGDDLVFGTLEGTLARVPATSLPD